MKNLIVFILLFFWMFSCKTNKPASSTKPVKPGHIKPIKKGEDFEKFNTRFHTDSVFQLSRVVFPVGGYYQDDKGKKQWASNNWIMHKTMVGAMSGTKEYKYSLVKTDSSIIEKIWTENGAFSFERKFVIKKKKWFLTFCKSIDL